MCVYIAQTSNCFLQRRPAYIIQEDQVLQPNKMWVRGSELELSLVFTVEEIPMGAVQGIGILSYATMFEKRTQTHSSPIMRHVWSQHLLEEQDPWIVSPLL